MQAVAIAALNAAGDPPVVRARCVSRRLSQCVDQDRHRQPGDEERDDQAAAMVSDSALKNAPVTPERNASGTKITMVAADDPTSGRRNSPAAATHALPCRCSPPAVQPPLDVLDHHDRVVDDQADGRRHAAQGHDVEAHSSTYSSSTVAASTAGTDERGDERDLPVAQEQQQHERRQHHADHHRIAHAAGGGDNQIALVIPVGDFRRPSLSMQTSLQFCQLRRGSPLAICTVLPPGCW